MLDGMESEEAKWKITEAVGGKKITKYKLRDWIFSRQHYWGEPIPIIHCEKCGVVPVDEKDLPVELPYVKKYEPTDTGESPLSAIDEWVNVKCPKCGGNRYIWTYDYPFELPEEGAMGCMDCGYWNGQEGGVTSEYMGKVVE